MYIYYFTLHITVTHRDPTHSIISSPLHSTITYTPIGRDHSQQLAGRLQTAEKQGPKSVGGRILLGAIYLAFEAAAWEVAGYNPCLGSWTGNGWFTRQGLEPTTSQVAAANGTPTTLGRIPSHPLPFGAATQEVAGSNPCLWSQPSPSHSPGKEWEVSRAAADSAQIALGWGWVEFQQAQLYTICSSQLGR